MKDNSEHTIDAVIEALKTTRDELSLNVHLMKMDMKDEWERIERQWAELDRELQPFDNAVETAASEVGAAAQLLLEEIGNGYKKIVKTL